MGLLALRTDHHAVREVPPGTCPRCGTPNYDGPGCFTCFNCGTRLREVADWNPSPDEWFAAVGEFLIERAAFMPGEMRKLAMATLPQGGDWVPLFEAARDRLLPVARQVLLGEQ